MFRSGGVALAAIFPGCGIAAIAASATRIKVPARARAAVANALAKIWRAADRSAPEKSLAKAWAALGNTPAKVRLVRERKGGRRSSRQSLLSIFLSNCSSPVCDPPGLHRL